MFRFEKNIDANRRIWKWSVSKDLLHSYNDTLLFSFVELGEVL